MAPKRASSHRPSAARHGFPDNDDTVDYEVQHLQAMNINAQSVLKQKPRGLNLPYYDRIEYDVSGRVAIPPPRSSSADFGSSSAASARVLHSSYLFGIR
ncbi:uncharacterized protein PGRI_034660 [Penicillium griseofulvum]|uniref:Uncharacterized protein n=1 Tax=Penicillium patulum TaxID=5078 RepID=A0A135LCW3_PENPA|nr:uncharacterized protein PGRI_034660 [Penicillium griseofulvum]KXG46720.1 hypothetical protein PGRI_034660 [Penicillium griseofulvum]